MSDPRYRPRVYCAEPDAFGRASTVDWNVPESGEETRTEAARLQHHYAVRIRREARNRYGSVSRYAETIGQTADRLGKILRGEAVMQLEDIAAARIHLDLREFA